MARASLGLFYLLQEFPLAVMSINMTGFVLDALRNGALTGACNRAHAVLSVVNTAYVALFLRFSTLWSEPSLQLF